MFKSSLCFFFMLILKLSVAQTPLYENIWVVWNIGQGQWVTHITTDSCQHFDFGGEPGRFHPLKSKLLKTCGQKNNILYLSHWDVDHYLHLFELSRSLPMVCWQQQPVLAPQEKLALQAKKLPLPWCPQSWTSQPQPILWRPSTFDQSALSKNESSLVLLEQNVLLPGDSPTKMENKWISEIAALEKTKFLVLGHHGSQSSTGTKLLKALKNLREVIASARYRKYHHPNTKTLNRLQALHVPVLKTEDWGNIWFTP